MINSKVSVFSIADYFETDHDRLDRLYRDYLQLKHVHFANARENFVSFKHGIERHIAWEEEILFPIFQKKTGIIDGPIAVMKEEHKQILSILKRINLNVQKNDASSNRLEHDLVLILGHHTIKEENVLYPVLDHLLSLEEKSDLHKQMQSITVNGSGICCAAS